MFIRRIVVFREQSVSQYPLTDEMFVETFAFDNVHLS